MCANDDVYMTVFQVFDSFFLFFGCLETIDVIDVDRESFQTFAESLVMLKREHCRRYEHRYLFGVAHCLEGGAYRYLGLAEAHVAADETVHRCL